MEIVRYDPIREAPYKDKNNRCIPMEFGKAVLF